MPLLKVIIKFVTTVLLAIYSFLLGRRITARWLPSTAPPLKWTEAFVRTTIPALLLSGLDVGPGAVQGIPLSISLVAQYVVIDSLIGIHDRYFADSPWEGRDEAIRCRDRLRERVDNMGPQQPANEFVEWIENRRNQEDAEDARVPVQRGA